MDSKALHNISYGLYIVSSKKEDRFNGQVANTVFQISNNPITIAISINKENLTNEYIKESRLFTVSILAQDAPLNLIRLFGFNSGRKVDKFADINFKLGENGVPYLEENILAYLAAEVVNEIDVETHTIFIGRVINAEVLQKGTPMTYAYYHQLKSGNVSVPVSENNRKKKENTMGKYVCNICGYIYDPLAGDPENGVAPNTSFEDLPDDWVCPVCGAGKNEFQELT